MVEYIDTIANHFSNPNFWLYDNIMITKSLVVIFLAIMTYVVATVLALSFYHDVKKKWVVIPGLPLFYDYKDPKSMDARAGDRSLGGDATIATLGTIVTFFIAMATQKIGIIILVLVLTRQALVVIVKLFTGEPKEEKPNVPCEIDREKFRYLRDLLEEEEEECKIEPSYNKGLFSGR